MLNKVKDNTIDLAKNRSMELDYGKFLTLPNLALVWNDILIVISQKNKTNLQHEESSERDTAKNKSIPPPPQKKK